MRLACACVVLLAGSALYAQASRETLTLDVLVEDAGARGVLRPSDFTVRDGDAALVVDAATLVRPSTDTNPLPSISARDDEAQVAAQASRIVGVYVDEYHLRDDAAFAAARAAVAGFVRTLGPRDLVVVRKPLDSLVTIRTSADHAAAALLVESATAREDDLAARSAFEQQFMAAAPARIRATRRQIVLSSVSALVSHLGSLPGGRKTLVVVSNGFQVPASPVRGELATAGIDALVRTANRERVAVYGVRPGPPGAEEAAAAAAATADGQPRELLEALAAPTSGFIVEGGAATDTGLARVVREAGSYYLLTVRTTPALADGGMRPLEVRTARGALRARAAFGLRRDVPPPFVPRSAALPEGLRVPRRVSPLIRTWFGQSSGGDGRTRVAFVWEPAPRVPGAGGPPALPSRVSMSVTTMDGQPVFTGDVSPSGRDAVVPSGRPVLAFEAAPATLLVQMEVLDAAGRVIDRDARDLVVAAFTAPVSFGSAAVYRARSARELRVIGEGGGAPVASRQFSRAEHLVVRVPVAGVPAAGDTIRARLQSRFGSRLRELVVRPSEQADGSVQVDVPLAGLASGEYAVEFEAAAGRGTVVARMDFAVTP